MSETKTGQTFTGLRMMDVRRQIAAAGKGMEQVQKHSAGHYTITTCDSRDWKVTETPSGLWRGEAQ